MPEQKDLEKPETVAWESPSGLVWGESVAKALDETEEEKCYELICRQDAEKNMLEKYQELHDRLLEIHEWRGNIRGTKRELGSIENLEEKLEGENDG